VRVVFAVLAALLLAGCERTPPPKPRPGDQPLPLAVKGPVAVTHVPTEAPGYFAGPADGKLHVYFLDVGQGDATLLVSPTGVTMLIDGGPEKESGHLVHRLPELLHATPDWIVLTDPKPEHLGGLTEAIQVFGGKHFLDPGLPSPSADYQELMAEVSARKLSLVTPAPDPAAPGAPVTFDLGGGARVQVFWPRAPVEQPLSAGDDFPDANALVLRVTFKNTSLLLASDMLAATEQYLLNKRLPFHSTLLKVADHGSDRASTEAFLDAVSPRAAILTTGTGPREGLPSPDTLARLVAIKARVFRSDLDGEIHAVSDGTAFTLSSERATAGAPRGTVHVFSTTPDAGLRGEHADAAQPPTEEEGHAPDHRWGRDDDDAPRAPLAKDVRYVASKNREVFHLPSCRYAKKIKAKNLVTFRTRAEALKHFRPAGDCHP